MRFFPHLSRCLFQCLHWYKEVTESHRHDSAGGGELPDTKIPVQARRGGMPRVKETAWYLNLYNYDCNYFT